MRIVVYTNHSDPCHHLLLGGSGRPSSKVLHLSPHYKSVNCWRSTMFWGCVIVISIFYALALATPQCRIIFWQYKMQIKQIYWLSQKCSFGSNSNLSLFWSQWVSLMSHKWDYCLCCFAQGCRCEHVFRLRFSRCVVLLQAGTFLYASLFCCLFFFLFFLNTGAGFFFLAVNMAV